LAGTWAEGDWSFCWQQICISESRVLSIALKRNGAYADDIKVSEILIRGFKQAS